MKTNLIIKHYGPDPFGGGGAGGAASSLAGGTPWGAAAQGAIGLAQTIGGWIQNRRATKQLEKLQSPTYSQNQGILDYYNKALERYNVSPTDSALYKRQTKNVLRGTAQGLGMLQDRRTGQAGVSGLIGRQNDALLNAEVAAEKEKDIRYGQLGQATGMKAGEDKMAFDINQQQPFQRKYNLLAMKAGGGASTMGAGISNLYGGASGINQYQMINKMYGGK